MEPGEEFLEFPTVVGDAIPLFDRVRVVGEVTEEPADRCQPFFGGEPCLRGGLDTFGEVELPVVAFLADDAEVIVGACAEKFHEGPDPGILGDPVEVVDLGQRLAVHEGVEPLDVALGDDEQGDAHDRLPGPIQRCKAPRVRAEGSRLTRSAKPRKEATTGRSESIRVLAEVPTLFQLS